MNSPHLKRTLLIILSLVWLQRVVRYSIRAFWIGAAVYLMAWGINELFGWIPNSSTWLVLGIISSAVIMIGIFYPWPRLSRLAWDLDRHFELKEQVSASLEALEAVTSGPLAKLLVEEVEVLLTKSIARVAKRGWFLSREILSSMIVGVLVWLVFWGNLAPFPQSITQTPLGILPPLGEDPTFGQIFPSGIPALEPMQPSTENGEPGSSTGQGSSGDGTGDGDSLATSLSRLKSLMSKLGEMLGQNIMTYEIGQELQRGNLTSAAEALERLSDRLPHLSNNNKQQLSESIEKIASEAAQAGENLLSDELLEISTALDRGDDLKASASLDNIANTLRQLDALSMTESMGMQSNLEDSTQEMDKSSEGSMQAGVSSGDRMRGEPEPFIRLQEGQSSVELGEVADRSGLLNPGIPDKDIDATIVQGKYDYISGGDGSVITNMLTPFYYTWIWRDVVSTYFTPH